MCVLVVRLYDVCETWHVAIVIMYHSHMHVLELTTRLEGPYIRHMYVCIWCTTLHCGMYLLNHMYSVPTSVYNVQQCECVVPIYVGLWLLTC